MNDESAAPKVPLSDPSARTPEPASPSVDQGRDARGAGAAPDAADEPVGEQMTLPNLPWAITEPDDDRSLPPWFRRAVILILILVAASKIVVWGFGQLTSFWYTLFFSFFIGLAMEPVVNYLQKHGIRRGVGTFMVMGGLILSAVAFFTVFGALLADQLSQLISSLPDVLATVLTWSNTRFGTQLDPNQILNNFGLGAQDIADLAKNLGVGLLSVLGTAVNWVFSLFTIMLFSFYFAADGPHFRRTVASWLPPHRQRTFLTVVDISTQKAGSYVISRGLLAMISAVFHGIAFYLLDLPYWLPMALWVGMVSQFIPTIGTYLAGALPVIIALVEGEPIKALIVLIVVVAYQQVENYLVAPRITRTTLEIHPAVAFGSVIAGAALFGVTGALLAIPVVATIQSVVTVYGRRYQLVEEFGGTPGESDQDRVAAAMRAADPRYSGSRSVPRRPIPPAPPIPPAEG